MRPLIILQGLLGMILASCQDSPSFSGYHHVDREAWHSEDTAVMLIQKADTACRHLPPHTFDMRVGVRYTSDYQYRDISLLVELTSGQKVLGRDTLLFNLFNDENQAQGRGLGHYDIEKPLRQVTLQADKAYEVRVTHLMRMNPVCGITDISYSFDPVPHPSAGK